MITAIIRNKENTLVLELPHSIYDIYEKLQSILYENEDDEDYQRIVFIVKGGAAK